MATNNSSKQYCFSKSNMFIVNNEQQISDKQIFDSLR